MKRVILGLVLGVALFVGQAMAVDPPVVPVPSANDARIELLQERAARIEAQAVLLQQQYTATTNELKALQAEKAKEQVPKK